MMRFQFSGLGDGLWPKVRSTAVDIEETRNHEYRLSVTYKFSIGLNGPYTGEGFWKPALTYHALQRVRCAQASLRIGQRVEVRYRHDDPSVNRLNGGVRRLLETVLP